MHGAGQQWDDQLGQLCCLEGTERLLLLLLLLLASPGCCVHVWQQQGPVGKAARPAMQQAQAVLATTSAAAAVCLRAPCPWQLPPAAVRLPLSSHGLI